MRKIIVNADDFGKSTGINHCILDCLKEKLITDTNLMVNMPGTMEAFGMIQKTSYRPGIHFCLTSDKLIKNGKPITTCPSLQDEEGYFFQPDKITFKIPFECWKKKEVKKELFLQLELFRENLNYLPSHFTIHHNITYVPIVAEVMAELSEKYKIPIRKLNNSWPFHLNDHYFNLYSEEDQYQKLIHSIKAIKTGIIEICVHPGYKESSSLGLGYNDYWQSQYLYLKRLKDDLRRENFLSYCSKCN